MAPTGQKGRKGMHRIRSLVILCLVALVMAVPSAVPASESCSMMSGTCRDVCAPNEKTEAGDFEDCGAKQECCVVFVETPVQCCVASLDAKNFGPSNCGEPVNGACQKGSGSPVPCAKLRMCATAK
jgi:hypothetical protein